MFKWRPSTRDLLNSLREEQSRLAEALNAGMRELRQEIADTRDEQRPLAEALKVGMQGLRQEIADSRDEQRPLAEMISVDMRGVRQEIADTRVELQAIRQELAFNREENLSIARQLDHVEFLHVSVVNSCALPMTNREENLSIARQLDHVLSLVEGIGLLRQEVATQLDYLREVSNTIGGIRHEIAATREEHVSLARSLDGLQSDLERLAMAVDDICTKDGHQLLELAGGAGRQLLRIAVIGTPRSGNTWLRLMLGRYYHLQESAADLPSEIGTLPARAIVQIHWPPEKDFVDLLSAQGIKPVVMARHPLDVLISLLHFIRYEPRTSRWLGGKAAIPADLIGKTPVSAEFRSYCLSQGAADLLAVTREWWPLSGIVRCRYEDLVQDTPATLRRVRNGLGVRGAVPLAEAAASVSLEDMRSLANSHGWRGSPGHWRKLMPPELAAEVYARHRQVFEVLGYDVGGYRLTEREAVAYWESIATDTKV